MSGSPSRRIAAAATLRPDRLSAPHLLLGLSVIVIWSSNFIVTWWGLQRVPPFALATLRFVLSAFPAVLILRRPRTSWWNLFAFGTVMGLGQFGLLFLALRESITPMLSSIVLQMQAFFTVLLAAAFLGERFGRRTMAAFAIAGVGLALVGVEAGAGATPLGIALVLLSATSWSVCNLIARRSGASSMVAHMAWSSLFAVPPLFIVSTLLEGPEVMTGLLRRPDPAVAGVLFWQAFANSLFGYGVWNMLLARYQASAVAPLSLLTPILTAVMAFALVGEPMPVWKILACALVIAALAVNMSGGRRAATPPGAEVGGGDSAFAARPPAP